MAAAWNPPLPRLPAAMARRQESTPLSPHKKPNAPTISGHVIRLSAMCSKYWLEKVQYILRKDIHRHKVFALHRYMSLLPRELRSSMIHNALRSGGLHLSLGNRELPSVNRSLILMTSELQIREPVYITLPKEKFDGTQLAPDLELLIRYGEGIQNVVFFLPDTVNEALRKVMKDICRTCRRMQRMTLHNATDDIITIVSRYCTLLVELNVSGSQSVTDEGVARFVTNIKYAPEDIRLNILNLDQTSVTEDCILNVIETLDGITSFGSKDIIDQLQIYQELTDGLKTTNITELNIRCLTVSRVDTIRKLCPNLSKLSVTFQENSAQGATLNDLRLLPKISELKITVKEPFLLTQVNLSDFVWNVGMNLKKLNLAGDIRF